MCKEKQVLDGVHLVIPTEMIRNKSAHDTGMNVQYPSGVEIFQGTVLPQGSTVEVDF